MASSYPSVGVTSTIPSLDNAGAEIFETPKPLSPEEVTAALNKEAFSFKVSDVDLVQTYHGTRVAAISPSEDQLIHGKFSSPWNGGPDWMAWGVFDGHGGYECAELLTQYLVPHVRDALKKVESPREKPGDVDDAIKSAFVKLDDSIMKPGPEVANGTLPFANKMAQLLPGYAGSCALLSLYDPATHLLRVACTGDSRAVLGQQNADGTWETIPLSTDQTAENPDEVARLNKEHPDEPEMISDGPGPKRVYGIMVSRAFGDGRYKWDTETRMKTKEQYAGAEEKPVMAGMKTPPYLTAEPVITTTEISSDKPSFLILASDGLWNIISNEQAVKLVSEWIKWMKTSGGNKPFQPTSTTEWKPFEIQTWFAEECAFKEEETIYHDPNPAVHLVRNAFGGAHQDKLSGLLTVQPPRGRNVRDDTTVQVIIFG